MTLIDSPSFTELLAYNELCPFGQEADWLRCGITNSTIANTSGHVKKSYPPSKFIPDFFKESESPKERGERCKAVMDALFAKLDSKPILRRKE